MYLSQRCLKQLLKFVTSLQNNTDIFLITVNTTMSIYISVTCVCVLCVHMSVCGHMCKLYLFWLYKATM